MNRIVEFSGKILINARHYKIILMLDLHLTANRVHAGAKQRLRKPLAQDHRVDLVERMRRLAPHKLQPQHRYQRRIPEIALLE